MLALVTYYLSILTFYMGVLIYALPVPHSGLKRWGPRLISDAFYTMALLFSATIVVKFAEEILGALGGEWGAFLSYLKGVMMLRSGLAVVLGSARWLLARTGIGSGLATILSPLISATMASLYAIIVMYALALLVRGGLWTLITLGTTLIAVPFRIARKAGAYLIAFALVFHVGLPLYPYFTALLLVPSRLATSFQNAVYGNIVNEFGERIHGGFLGLELDDDKYVGPIPVDSGTFIIPYGDEVAKMRITIVYDVCGRRFATNVTRLSLSEICGKAGGMCRVTVEVKELLDYSNGIAIYSNPKPQHASAMISGQDVNVELQSAESLYMYLLIPNAYRVEALFIDNLAVEDIDELYNGSWRWYDVGGSTYVIPIQPGTHTVRVRLSTTGLASEPDESHAYEALQNLISYNLFDIQGFIEEALRVFYVDLVSAVLYLSLLLTITTGLATLLGGSGKLRVTL